MCSEAGNRAEDDADEVAEDDEHEGHGGEHLEEFHECSLGKGDVEYLTEDQPEHERGQNSIGNRSDQRTRSEFRFEKRRYTEDEQNDREEQAKRAEQQEVCHSACQRAEELVRVEC